MSMTMSIRVLCVAAALAGAAGCFATSKPVATPADLERLGTRQYPDRNAEEVSKAAVTALKLLGYEVVTTDPRIRTARAASRAPTRSRTPRRSPGTSR